MNFLFPWHSSHHHWALVVGRLLSVEVGGFSSFLDHELPSDDEGYSDSGKNLDAISFGNGRVRVTLTAPASRIQVTFPLVVSSVKPLPSPSLLYLSSIPSTLGVN